MSAETFLQIFISYVAEQRDIAQEIALALRAEGYQVFHDRADLDEGDAYNQRIREALQASDLLVFLVSPQSVSAGRYTLTELAFAEQKWTSPAGHVLPVMVQPTESTAIPAYLRAVVMLRPAGSVSAEVLAAVDRMKKATPWRTIRRYGVPALVLALIVAGLGTWQAIGRWRACGEAERVAEQAKLQRGAGDYASAWESYRRALGVCPNSRMAIAGQEILAMEWLQNIRVTQGKQTFTDIVEQIRPVLSQAAVSEDARQAANALAHLGWSDFLRSRDGNRGLDPTLYYRQALQKDPANVYAHAFWGHYIMVTDGDLEAAQAHFTQAAATPQQRAFVRGLQVSALMWRDSLQTQEEVIRVANQMRQEQEAPSKVAAESTVSRIWNVYYDRLLRGREAQRFLNVLNPQDHVATFEWLFPQYAAADSNRLAYLLMLARLQEHNAQSSQALATYRTVLSALTSSGSSGGSLLEAARQGVRRLQPR